MEAVHLAPMSRFPPQIQQQGQDSVTVLGEAGVGQDRGGGGWGQHLALGPAGGGGSSLDRGQAPATPVILAAMEALRMRVSSG